MMKNSVWQSRFVVLFYLAAVTILQKFLHQIPKQVRVRKTSRFGLVIATGRAL